jgi:hypothetical protein
MLEDYKIEIVNGVNDNPVAPTPTTGCNGAYLIDKHNSLIQHLIDNEQNIEDFRSYTTTTDVLNGDFTFYKTKKLSLSVKIDTEKTCWLLLPDKTIYMKSVLFEFLQNPSANINVLSHTYYNFNDNLEYTNFGESSNVPTVNTEVFGNSYGLTRTFTGISSDWLDGSGDANSLNFGVYNNNTARKLFISNRTGYPILIMGDFTLCLRD